VQARRHIGIAAQASQADVSSGRFRPVADVADIGNHRLMWLMILALVSPAEVHSAVESVRERPAYGPPQILSCDWFTNFENSRFVRCKGPAGIPVPLGEGASIRCSDRTCERLEEEARRTSPSREREPPSGTFKVRVVGRVSLHQHQKRYLGDGTSTVLIEKVLSVRKSE
jgi:hypothetical protein